MPPGAGVVVTPPAGAVALDAAALAPIRPALGGGSEATLAQLDGHRDGAGDLLLAACVATPIPGWVEDMRPSIEGRLAAFAITSAEKLVAGELEARPAPGGMVLFPRGATAAPPVGVTRTFLGFRADHQVLTCFATCATPAAAPPHVARACDASVAAARLESAPPPPPGIVLASTTWAIHHPHPTMAWAGITCLALAAVAMGWRKRPRSRI